jgi:IS5 family transposase
MNCSTKRPMWRATSVRFIADSAYRSEAQEQRLADAEIESQVCEKGTRGKPLTEEQTLSNRTKPKVRAQAEHVFGAQAAMGGHWVRTIGLQRANVKIGLMNLVYNMKRLLQLLNRNANAVKRGLMNHHRKGTPAVA